MTIGRFINQAPAAMDNLRYRARRLFIRMNDRLLSIYHSLPPRLRSWAASLRGLQLRNWRYGADAERLVSEVLEHESWSAEKWGRWREERLAFILHRAATMVPFYREEWARRRRRGDQ